MQSIVVNGSVKYLIVLSEFDNVMEIYCPSLCTDMLIIRLPLLLCTWLVLKLIVGLWGNTEVYSQNFRKDAFINLPDYKEIHGPV